jgi:hypothetical protein
MIREGFARHELNLAAARRRVRVPHDDPSAVVVSSASVPALSGDAFLAIVIIIIAVVSSSGDARGRREDGAIEDAESGKGVHGVSGRPTSRSS